MQASRTFQAGIELWTQLVRRGIEEGVFCDDDPRLMATTAFAIMQVQLACLLEAGEAAVDPRRSANASRASSSARWHPRRQERVMSEPRIVFQDANLVDGKRPARPGSHVVVSGSRIERVGPGRAETRPGDRVIELGGRTLMPGMVQSHFHASLRRLRRRHLGALPRPRGLARLPLDAGRAQRAHRARVRLHRRGRLLESRTASTWR